MSDLGELLGAFLGSYIWSRAFRWLFRKFLGPVGSDFAAPVAVLVACALVGDALSGAGLRLVMLYAPGLVLWCALDLRKDLRDARARAIVAVMRGCPGCHTQNDADASFCKRCGAALGVGG